MKDPLELLQDLKIQIKEDMKQEHWNEENKIGMIRVIDLINLKIRSLEEKSLD
jgi:hypothetical protein